MNPKPTKSAPSATHRLVHILEQKNESLEKFYNLSRERIHCFERGDFRQLKNFYLVRENLLQGIGRLDAQIEGLGDVGAPTVELSPSLHKHILQLQKIRRHWVTQILWQDLHLLSFVEKAKSKMIRDLKSQT